MREIHRVWEAALLVVSLSTAGFGCQIVGGLSSELTVAGADGGSGGGGASGGSGGGGLVVRDPLIWVATDPGPTFVYTLPDWLTYGFGAQLDPSERTTEIGPSQIRRGYAAKDPRPRNVGAGWGLLLEAERTNLVSNSGWSGAGWTSDWFYMAEAPGVADPAGGSGAVEFTSMSGQQSNTATADGRVATTWARGTAGTAPYAYFAYGGSAVSVLDTSFTRYEVKRDIADTNGAVRLETQAVAGLPAIDGATKIEVFGVQVEQGLYPTSYIPTSGGSVKRRADALGIERTNLAPGGYFDVTIRYAPHYAKDEQEFPHDLLMLISDGVFLRMKPGGTLVLASGGPGVNPQIEGLDWSRGQELTVRAQYLPDKRVITVGGTMLGEVSAETAGGGPALASTPTAFLLGDGGGSQESADLRYLEIH